MSEQSTPSAAEDAKLPSPFCDPEPLPDALALRLRRAKAKVDAMHHAADAIYRHVIDEAAEEIGIPGIGIDIDKGVFARPNHVQK